MQGLQLFAKLYSENLSVVNDTLDQLIEYVEEFKDGNNDGSILKYYLKHSPKCSEIIDLFKRNVDGAPGFCQEKAVELIKLIFSSGLEGEKEVVQSTVNYLFNDLITNFMRWLSYSKFHSRVACMRLITFLLKKDIKMFKLILPKVVINYSLWKDFFQQDVIRKVCNFREAVVDLIDAFSDGCNSRFALNYLNEYLATANPLSILVEDLINDSEELQDKLFNSLIKMIKSPYMKEKQISYFFKRNILVRLYFIFLEPTFVNSLKELLYLLFTVPGYLTPLEPSNKQIHYSVIVGGMENFSLSHKETRKLLLSIFQNQPAVVAQMYLNLKNFGFHFDNDLPTFIQISFLLEMFNTIKLPVTPLTPSSYDFIKDSIVFVPKTVISRVLQFGKLFQYEMALVLYSMLSRAEVYAKSTNADPVLMANICSEFPDSHTIFTIAKTSHFALAKCFQCFEILHRISPSVYQHTTLRMEQVIQYGLQSNNKLVLYRTLKLAEELGDLIVWVSPVTQASMTKKLFPASIIPIKARVKEVEQEFPFLSEELDRILAEAIFKNSPYESFVYRMDLGNDITEVLKIGKATHSYTPKSIFDSRFNYKKIKPQYDLPALFHFILLGHEVGVGKNNEEKSMILYYKALIDDEHTELTEDRKKTIVDMIKSTNGFNKIQLLICLFRLRKGIVFDKEVRDYIKEKYDLTKVDDGDIIFNLKEEITEEINKINFRKYSIQNDVIDSFISNILLQISHTKKLFDSPLYCTLIHCLIEIIMLLTTKKQIGKELMIAISNTIIPYFESFSQYEQYYLDLADLFLVCNENINEPSSILIQTLFKTTQKKIQKRIIENNYFGTYLSRNKIDKYLIKAYLMLMKSLPKTSKQISDVYGNKGFVRKLKIGLSNTKDCSALFNWYWKGIWGIEKDQTLQIIGYLAQNKKEFIQSLVLHSCPIERTDSFESICQEMLIPINLMIYSVDNNSPLTINFVLTKLNLEVNEKRTEEYLNLLLNESIKSKKIEWIEKTLEQIHVVLNTQQIKIAEEVLTELKDFIPQLNKTVFTFVKDYIKECYVIESNLEICHNKLFNLIVALIGRNGDFLGDKSITIFKEVIDKIKTKQFENEYPEHYKDLIGICSKMASEISFEELLRKKKWTELIVHTIKNIKYGYGIVPLFIKVIEDKHIQKRVIKKLEKDKFKPKWELPVTHDFVVLITKLYGIGDKKPSFEMMKMIFESYNGTISNTDKMLFYLINKYASLYPTLPLLAGNHGFDYKTSINRLFDNGIFFNKKDMEYSLSHFPLNRQFNKDDIEQLMISKDIEEVYSYDPCYLLPLIYYCLDRCIVFKKYIFQPKFFVMNGFLSFAIISTASVDEKIRKIGYSILQKTLYILKIRTTFFSFNQRSFIQSFIFILRNSIDIPNQQLSAPTAVLYSKMVMILVQRVDPLWIAVVDYLFKRKECKISLNPFNFMSRLEEYSTSATILLLESLAQSTSIYPTLPSAFVARSVYETLLVEITNPHTFYYDCRNMLILFNKLLQKWGATDSCIFYFVQLLQCRNATKLIPLIVDSIKSIVSFKSFIETTKNQVPLAIIIIRLLQSLIENERDDHPETIEGLKSILGHLKLSSSNIPPLFSFCSNEMQNQLLSLCYLFEQNTTNVGDWFIWN